MSTEQSFVLAAQNSWKGAVDRVDKFFGHLPAEQLQKEVAPGKNRLIYIWGHLTSVHDAMLPLLGLGDRLHPEFDAAFVSNPDKSQPNIPSAEQVRNAWNEINAKLWHGISKYSAADFLKKHSAVSDEDFAKEPHRNRLAIVLGRASHIHYHLGQTALAPK